MVQAYVDDGGGKGQGRVFVFSALVAAAEQWARFSDRWSACLFESPKIRYFKMDEAASCDGEFRGFSEPERDEKLKRLCAIMDSAGLTEIAMITDLKDFSETWGTMAGRPLSEPYFFPFQMVCVAIGYEILRRGETEPVEIFFDENVIFGPRAKAWYPVIRAMQEEILKPVMPVEPFFRSDRDVLPLQAADLTAWIDRRADEGGLGKFEWLYEAIKNIPMSPLSKLLDAQLIDSMRIAPGNDPEAVRMRSEVMKAYRETFGFDWPPLTKQQRKRHQGREKK